MFDFSHVCIHTKFKDDLIRTALSRLPARSFTFSLCLCVSLYFSMNATKLTGRFTPNLFAGCNMIPGRSLLSFGEINLILLKTIIFFTLDLVEASLSSCLSSLSFVVFNVN